MTTYRITIPVHSDHVAIILGRNFSTLNKIKKRFNVGIHFNKAESYKTHRMPYFVVCGQENQVNLCINEIQRLVIISMTNYIKRFNHEPESSYDSGSQHGEQYVMMKRMVDKDSGILIDASPVATL